MPTGKPGNAMSVAERSRRHRTRERERELQVALAVARLVMRRDPGDARMSLAEWLERIVERGEIPEDYADEIRDAAERLSRRRLR